MALSQSPTLTKLAEKLIQQLRGVDADPTGDEKELLTQAKIIATQHGAEVSSESIIQLAEDIESRDAAAKDQIIN